MNIDVNVLPYSKTIANVMYEAKHNELLQTAEKYNISLDELKVALDKRLSESNMKIGACNTAIDFLIVDTLNKNHLHKSVGVAIAENILASAIYYANGIGKSEYV